MVDVAGYKLLCTDMTIAPRFAALSSSPEHLILAINSCIAS